MKNFSQRKKKNLDKIINMLKVPQHHHYLACNNYVVICAQGEQTRKRHRSSSPPRKMFVQETPSRKHFHKSYCAQEEL